MSVFATIDCDQFDHWCSACASNGGTITIPEHQAQEYLVISGKEEAYNGWRDRPQGGRYHSQCSVTHPELGRLVFNFWGAKPIFTQS